MKKALFLVVLVLLTAAPAYALDVTVDRYGNVVLYDDVVLGQSTTRDENESEVEKQPVKRVPARDDKQLLVGAINSGVQLRIQPTTNVGSDEVFETKRLDMEVPAGLTEKQREAIREREEEMMQNATPSGEQYREMIRTERENRGDETFTVRNRVAENGLPELELQSRNVRAALNGASFALDPETNVATVTTPSGQEHVLNHLPDQALERMQKLVSLNPETTELQVETNDGGDVVYTTIAQRTKRLLGLFPLNVESKVVLNDTTGEIVEEPAPTTNLWENLLQRLSF